MPRQTRRARLQSGARKRTSPAIPRHLIDRIGAATLESPPADVDGGVGHEELEAAPDMAAAPLIERTAYAQPPRPAPPSTFIKRTPAVEKTNSIIASRLATTDYGYVVGELKRIIATAAMIVVLLAIVALLRR